MLINSVGQTFRQDTAGMACRCSMIYIKLHIAGGEWNSVGQISGVSVPHISDVWAGVTQSWAHLGPSLEPLSALWLCSELDSVETKHSKRAKQKFSGLIAQPHKSYEFTSPILYLQSSPKDPMILGEGEDIEYTSRWERCQRICIH